MTTIAIIGAGAMGSGIAGLLTRNGCKVLTRLGGRSPASRARAAAAGMEDATLAAIAECELILSIVPPAMGEDVVDALAPVFAEPHAPLFCDANALAPESKHRMAARVASLGGRMVDGSIIGGPPTAGYDGPRLYLCGNGAETIARLDRFGLDTRVLAGPFGAAAALKMCYGGINKGMIGLVTAMLLAAQRHGAAEDLAGELALSQKELLARMRVAIPKMYPKAWRWDAEMHEIAAFLADGDPSAAAIWSGLGAFYTDRATPEAQEHEPGGLKKLLG